MKKLVVIAGLIFGLAGNAMATEVVASSRVAQVTVYASSAFVTRTAPVQVKTGDTRVVFPEIIPEIDEGSLRVKGRGNAGVKLLGAQLQRKFTEETPVERIERLQEAIEVLEDENVKFGNEQRALDEEKKYLESVRLFAGGKIPEDLVTKMPTTQDLEAVRLYLGEKFKENLNARQAIDIAVRKNLKKLEALRRELKQISGPGQKMTRSIIIEIEVTREGSLDLEVSYRVHGASWEALYDARAALERSQVELIAYGIVRQNTGEDWEDVEMSLSTAQVTGGGNMPEAQSWFIRPYQPPVPIPLYSRQKAIAGAARSEMKTEMAQGTPGVADAMMMAAAPLEAENAYAQTESKGVSVAYKLSRKVTVRSGGEDHKLPISAQDLAAQFEYSAYPRVTTLAYLRSRVTNDEDLQLLGGRVNVFLEGDFVGTSRIMNTAPGQEFDLYLGIDENVKVERELLEKKKDNVLIGGIPSPTMKETYKYKVTVENYKAVRSRVNLFEAMPVSEDERIKVKVSQVSVEPADKEWKDRKGVWRWDIALEPKTKHEIFYTFMIEYPRDMRVEGLDWL
ncbi:MAG: mucoidy inhibitor MuiA family protein [Candidatus Omnitrophica bacterium]|nr:mucoidy inhibitor MuiA family protein [Candidatus Omnitrophota bacterium]